MNTDPAAASTCTTAVTTRRRSSTATTMTTTTKTSAAAASTGDGASPNSSRFSKPWMLSSKVSVVAAAAAAVLQNRTRIDSTSSSKVNTTKNTKAKNNKSCSLVNGKQDVSSQQIQQDEEEEEELAVGLVKQLPPSSSPNHVMTTTTTTTTTTTMVKESLASTTTMTTRHRRSLLQQQQSMSDTLLPLIPIQTMEMKQQQQQQHSPGQRQGQQRPQRRRSSQPPTIPVVETNCKLTPRYRSRRTSSLRHGQEEDEEEGEEAVSEQQQQLVVLAEDNDIASTHSLLPSSQPQFQLSIQPNPPLCQDVIVPNAVCDGVPPRDHNNTSGTASGGDDTFPATMDDGDNDDVNNLVCHDPVVPFDNHKNRITITGGQGYDMTLQHRRPLLLSPSSAILPSKCTTNSNSSSTPATISVNANPISRDNVHEDVALPTVRVDILGPLTDENVLMNTDDEFSFIPDDDIDRDVAAAHVVDNIITTNVTTLVANSSTLIDTTTTAAAAVSTAVADACAVDMNTSACLNEMDVDNLVSVADSDQQHEFSLLLPMEEEQEEDHGGLDAISTVTTITNMINISVPATMKTTPSPPPKTTTISTATIDQNDLRQSPQQKQQQQQRTPSSRQRQRQPKVTFTFTATPPTTSERERGEDDDDDIDLENDDDYSDNEPKLQRKRRKRRPKNGKVQLANDDDDDDDDSYYEDHNQSPKKTAPIRRAKHGAVTGSPPLAAQQKRLKNASNIRTRRRGRQVDKDDDPEEEFNDLLLVGFNFPPKLQVIYQMARVHLELQQQQQQQVHRRLSMQLLRGIDVCRQELMRLYQQAEAVLRDLLLHHNENESQPSPSPLHQLAQRNGDTTTTTPTTRLAQLNASVIELRHQISGMWCVYAQIILEAVHAALVSRKKKEGIKRKKMTTMTKQDSDDNNQNKCDINNYNFVHRDGNTSSKNYYNNDTNNSKIINHSGRTGPIAWHDDRRFIERYMASAVSGDGSPKIAIPPTLPWAIPNDGKSSIHSDQHILPQRKQPARLSQWSDFYNHVVGTLFQVRTCPLVGNHSWLSIALVRLLSGRCLTSAEERGECDDHRNGFSRQVSKNNSNDDDDEECSMVPTLDKVRRAILVCHDAIESASPRVYGRNGKAPTKPRFSWNEPCGDLDKLLLNISPRPGRRPWKNIVDGDERRPLPQQQSVFAMSLIVKIQALCPSGGYLFRDKNSARELCVEVNRLSRMEENIFKSGSNDKKQETLLSEKTPIESWHPLEYLAMFRVVDLARYQQPWRRGADHDTHSSQHESQRARQRGAALLSPPPRPSLQTRKRQIGLTLSDIEKSSLYGDNNYDDSGDCDSNYSFNETFANYNHKKFNTMMVDEEHNDYDQVMQLEYACNRCFKAGFSSSQERDVHQRECQRFQWLNDSEQSELDDKNRLSQTTTDIVENELSSSRPDELIEVLDFLVDLVTVSRNDVRLLEHFYCNMPTNAATTSFPSVGQVGLRCRFCKSWAVPGSFEFPRSCDAIGDAMGRLCNDHFDDQCETIPLEEYKQYKIFRQSMIGPSASSSSSSSIGSRKLFADYGQQLVGAKNSGVALLQSGDDAGVTGIFWRRECNRKQGKRRKFASDI